MGIGEIKNEVNEWTVNHYDYYPQVEEIDSEDEIL